MKPSLSIIVIVKNAAETIERCLNSVSFADEIIVLDSGSTDNTLALCRGFTAHVYETDWLGFGIQKNRALAKATGEWVYSIDADEWMDEALQQEIQTVLKTPVYTTYQQPRKNRCLGRWMKHGDMSRDKVTRLFKRDHATFTNNQVHESLQVTSPTGELKNPLLHDSFTTLSQIIEKANKYSSLFASDAAKTKKGGYGRGLLSGSWIFVRNYFMRLGLLDGRPGFAIALGFFLGAFLKYAKLYEKNKLKN